MDQVRTSLIGIAKGFYLILKSMLVAKDYLTLFDKPSFLHNYVCSKRTFAGFL